MRKAQKRGYSYEKQQTRKHKGIHVGGPGREDYRRKSTKGEVKDLKRKLTRPEVIALVRKGRKEITNKGGFTNPALDYGKSKSDVKLFYRRTRVA